MEPHQTKRARNILITICGAAVVGVPLVMWMAASLHSAPLSTYVRKDMPALELELQFKDVKGKPVPPENTKLAGGVVKNEDAGREDKCPELIGGDTPKRSTLADLKKMNEGCSQRAKWVVKRHPIGFSLYVQDGDKTAEWLQKEGGEDGLLSTKLFRGLFHDLQHTSKIRAEDLQVSGIEGAFLSRLFIEALRADAVLHYDISHGEKGFVFSFVRRKCAFSAKALPVFCGVLARSAYKIPMLKEPLLEMSIGLQRIFLTQCDDRVYLSNGLEALLNVLENEPAPPVNPPQSPVVLTVRAEAFVDRFLPVVTSEKSWEVTAGFGWPADKDPGVIRFPGGKFARHLRPKIFSGVFAGIPHDAFAAVVTSFYVPPNMEKDWWSKLAANGPGDEVSRGPQEGGFALIWDLEHSEDGISGMGVVIAAQTKTDETASFSSYFADQDLTSECGGGTVFLAATSQNLLNRMREGCARQSLSVLDWEGGSRRGEYEGAQIMMFLNPGVAMRELTLAGDAGKNQLYEDARIVMQKEAQKDFSRLPIFAYSGTAGQGDMIQLKGFTVNQGAAQ
ncbi:MAG: hypothetical protein ABSF52_17705 [Syntrophobacteraceae bacterium]